MNESPSTTRRAEIRDDKADSALQNAPDSEAAAGPDNAVVDVTLTEHSTADALTDDEFHQHRQEKLDSIRSAIAAGAYDADDLLETAMLRMLQRLDLADELDLYEENN